MSIEAWVYINQLPLHRVAPRILSKYGNERDDFRGWEWVLLASGRMQFRVNQDGPEQLGTRGDVFLYSTDALPTETWVHVVTVIDVPGKEIVLYINGELDGRQVLTTSHPLRCNSDQALYFGRFGGYDGFRFDGRLDELRVVAEALSFSAPPLRPYDPAQHANTIALFHFDAVTDTFTIPNSAGDGLTVFIPMDSDRVLGDSLAGYGHSLNLTTDGD